MRTLVHVALALCVAAPALSAQFMEVHSEHFLFGYPTGMPVTNDLVIRDLYAVSTNDQTKFADWVAYRLTAAEVVGSLDLERDWRNDPWLEDDERLEARPTNQDDFRGANTAAGYDRGHLAPLASFKGSPQASQVNYYSNIVPQLADLNQGPWQRLEQVERDFACSGEILWVMTGPLYGGAAVAQLPNANEGHTVPTGFWKILATVEPPGVWVAAFIFEQDTPRNDPVGDHLVSVDDVEARSGLDFFRELDAGLQANVESVALTAAAWSAALPVRGCLIVAP